MPVANRDATRLMDMGKPQALNSSTRCRALSVYAISMSSAFMQSLISSTSGSRVIPQSLSRSTVCPSCLSRNTYQTRSFTASTNWGCSRRIQPRNVFVHMPGAVKTFQHVPSLAMPFLETWRRQAEESLIGGQNSDKNTIEAGDSDVEMIKIEVEGVADCN
jgi:hypothetical protein